MKKKLERRGNMIGEGDEGRDARPLSKKEISEYQKVIEEVGSRKNDGLIYIASNTHLKGRSYNAKGIVFANNVSKQDMAFNLIDALYSDKMDKMFFAVALVEHFKQNDRNERIRKERE